MVLERKKFTSAYNFKIFGEEITSVNQTERKLRDNIDIFHSTLNKAEIVPHGCYRRNKLHYRAVCYVNNIIGLYLSSSFDVIPIFINRAFKEIQFIRRHYTDNVKVVPTYYKIVFQYLGLISKICYSQDSIPEYMISRIPKELLKGRISIGNV